MKMDQRGSLLIASLAMMVLLTVLMAGLVYNISEQVHVYNRFKQEFEGRMAFMDGFWAVTAMIYNDPMSYIDHLNKEWYGQIKLPDFLKDNLQVIVGDEESKLNLNKIPTNWLEAFLKEREEEGLSSEQTRKFEKELLDQRAKKPLVSVDELYLLKEIDPETIQKITPFVTIYTDGAQININTASEEVLRSLIFSVQGDETAQKTILDAIMNKRPFFSDEFVPAKMTELMKLPKTMQVAQVLNAMVPYVTVNSCTYNMKMKFRNSQSAEIVAKESGTWSNLKILSWFEL
ncbi:MAG: hypothetical protein WC530_04730 [Candidatus Omnitrophota bacterium]|jgi:type II secretory pathway component PulK